MVGTDQLENNFYRKTQKILSYSCNKLDLILTWNKAVISNLFFLIFSNILNRVWDCLLFSTHPFSIVSPVSHPFFSNFVCFTHLLIQAHKNPSLNSCKIDSSVEMIVTVKGLIYLG